MADATAEFSGALGIKETPLALLVDIDGKEYWIPKSQIDDDSEVWLADFCFMATTTFQPDPPYPTFHVDSVEDFEPFLRDTSTNADDRMMFATWLAMGLREAILNVDV